MNCPKCGENSLSKIQFKISKKTAYLCSICSTFWYVGEHMDLNNGHPLEEPGDDQHTDDAFAFVDRKDKEYQEDIDESERVAYELL